MWAAFSFVSYFATSGPKPMETWCGEDSSMGNSWDQEEEVEIGMWNNNQQDSRSNDQNTWNYKNKNSYKVCLRRSFFLVATQNNRSSAN